MDRSPSPSEANFTAEAPTSPVGIAVVTPVSSATARDELSLATLRSLALEGLEDPLVLAGQNNGDVELVDLQDISTPPGFRGERIVFNIRIDDTNYVTIDHTALTNNDTTQIYRLMLKCEATCYEDHRSEINDIVESWTIDQED
jgi:hypothetical protein